MEQPQSLAKPAAVFPYAIEKFSPLAFLRYAAYFYFNNGFGGLSPLE